MSENSPDMERLKHFLPFDSLSDSHLNQIQGRVTVVEPPPKKLVFKRDDAPEKALYLIAGTVDLIDADFNVQSFSANHDENYLALDDHPRHTVTCITTSPAIFYEIDRNHLDLLMTWTQATESLQNETEQGDTDWMDALLASELFNQIPPANIQSLFAKFEEIPVDMGTPVICEGDAGDRFYVIKAGKAIITRSLNGRAETLATLGSGGVFGEDALIADIPRNATVTMTSDGILMGLTKDDFQELLQSEVIQRLDQATYDGLVEDGDRACVLIDVRHAMEFRHDRTAGARNIPLSELRQKARTLEKEFIYIVWSDGSRRAELAAYLLSEAGLEAYVLDTGEEAAETPSHDAGTAE